MFEQAPLFGASLKEDNMVIAFRRIARQMPRLALLVLMGFAAGPRGSVAASPGVLAVAENHFFYPEVRLRKLHLVRPDLIPYPIAFEVYC